MAKPVLELTDIECSVGGKRLLQLPELGVEVGECFGVVGPNGAGKSTLLKVITGELASQGEVRFHDRPMSQWHALARARHLAVLPQASQLSFPFTAAEVVSLGATPLKLGRSELRRELQRHMSATRCDHLAARPYPRLSGGERQRVQLARVLLQLSQAANPPLLLLDEPTSAQDLGQQHGLLRLARELCDQRGFTVLAVLHDLNHVLHYCDRCAVLASGFLLETGAPATLLTARTVERHWGYRPEILGRADGRRVLA